jgi:mannose-6-phosphate isomerase-like protein (cupin superfamily)
MDCFASLAMTAVFLPPGVEHAISNSGLVDLVFLVITSPVTDDEKPL